MQPSLFLYQRIPKTRPRISRMQSQVRQRRRRRLARSFGSTAVSFGSWASEVRDLPKAPVTRARALMAQPLALSTGPRLRRRSFRQAMNTEGREITSMMQAITRRNCQIFSDAMPWIALTRNWPRKPRAMPMAAKIPANLAISKDEVIAAAGAGFSPSVPVALSAAEVRSPIDFSFFLAAILSIFSEIHLATFL